jgi:hypothetical protein
MQEIEGHDYGAVVENPVLNAGSRQECPHLPGTEREGLAIGHVSMHGSEAFRSENDSPENKERKNRDGKGRPVTIQGERPGIAAEASSRLHQLAEGLKGEPHGSAQGAEHHDEQREQQSERQFRRIRGENVEEASAEKDYEHSGYSHGPGALASRNRQESEHGPAEEDELGSDRH